MSLAFVGIWYKVCDSEIYEGESNCRSPSLLFTRRSWRDPRRLSGGRHHEDWSRIMEDVFWWSNKSKWKRNWSSLNFSKRDTHSIFWQTQLSCHQQYHKFWSLHHGSTSSPRPWSKKLELYSDSAWIISQIQNKWKIKEEMLMPYHECLQKWASKFSKIQYQYMSRMQNQIRCFSNHGIYDGWFKRRWS